MPFEWLGLAADVDLRVRMVADDGALAPLRRLGCGTVPLGQLGPDSSLHLSAEIRVHVLPILVDPLQHLGRHTVGCVPNDVVGEAFPLFVPEHRTHQRAGQAEVVVLGVLESGRAARNCRWCSFLSIPSLLIVRGTCGGAAVGAGAPEDDFGFVAANPPRSEGARQGAAPITQSTSATLPQPPLDNLGR